MKLDYGFILVSSLLSLSFFFFCNFYVVNIFSVPEKIIHASVSSVQVSQSRVCGFVFVKKCPSFLSEVNLSKEALQPSLPSPGLQCVSCGGIYRLLQFLRKHK